MSAFWWGLEMRTRRRLAAALGGLVAILGLTLLAVPALPCELPGGGQCQPPDHARGIVPAEAVAYLHIDLDPDREQLAAAGDALARVPTIAREILGDLPDLVPGGAGELPQLAAAIGPWVGDEAALAVLPGTGRGTEHVWLLAAEDPDGATAFAERLIARPRIERHLGVELKVDRGRDVAAALVEGFLAVGSERALRGVIDVASGDGAAPSIAGDVTASEVREELPEPRFAEAYLSPEGAELLLADAPAASLAPFVSAGSARGVGAALAAGDDELELAIRSVLDPERARAEPGFFTALSPFEPALPERLPGDSLAYAGFGDPEATVSALLAQASSEAPGVARGFERLVGELRRDGEIDVEHQLLPALGDEAALVVEPRTDPELDGIEAAPLLEFVARDVDAERAREALARLQGSVVEAIDPGVGLQAPVFTEVDVGGMTAQSVRLSPTIELTHAILDDLAVIATHPHGIERLANPDGSLSEAEAFERATAGFPDSVSLLAFLDLRGLISAAERLGLAADPVYAAFAGEVRSLHGFGLAVRHDDDLLATDARLILGGSGGEAPPAVGEWLADPGPDPGLDPIP